MRRGPSTGVRYERTGDGGVTIPGSVFDGFIENCLVNARRKREADPAVHVTVQLAVAGGRAVLEVTDTGAPVAPDIAPLLFTEPIPRAEGGGFAIGLYQVGRLAAQSGYVGMLAHNEPGRVVFRLAPA